MGLLTVIPMGHLPLTHPDVRAPSRLPAMAVEVFIVHLLEIQHEKPYY